ncbi:ABC transporter ATP-binding protein [Beduini massiliensis]|uniref:ABC transporter ATP-binding protein n=1 Tax=Beduini massiliensis TaxID=1585974 RepID=UPI000693D918|nr:dipeptide/oligopeptide/nickel ABC transporter ATP-binding protein [Beduini massiliensis]
MDEPIFSLKDVSQVYINNSEKNEALKHVNLTIYHGECLGIVGQSGCGKSTLGKIISLIDKPTQGEVYYQGNKIQFSDRSIYPIRKEIQYIFQDPISAFSPRKKIIKFLLEPYVNFKLCPKKEALIQIEHYLKQVGLDQSCLNKYPHQLSGGQLQRIVIARTLSLSPKLIVCDEMTSALDVIVQDEILTLMKKLQIENQLTLVFISHDLSIVQRFCDRTMVLFDGEQIECLNSKDFTASKHPYIELLKDAIL